jgi:hypothetical protein
VIDLPGHEVTAVGTAPELGLMASFDRNFRFLESRLQGELIGLVSGSGVAHAIDCDETLRYAAADAELVENELICSIRNQVFPKWHIFTLEGDEMRRPDVTARYRTYMAKHNIPFFEELHNGFHWFLAPEEYDSFDWKIAEDDNA